ncbi:ProQ/FINO family protein [Alysiella filiformis]|uniref:ProQ/FINO family protein n=1 Tax=Alysiella filiformis DSM 16848 TaxID=1120981 RepID=A0A286EAM8_9NEIS|nr:ProQ/FINO family protein [Alysiella filiformis]QMT32273.1 osmoprotectant transport activator ProQ [Alysiella filiformis]UBQ56806.1 ProQ/FinO family protein [Alysiella filiformis DSM 16848]SOD67977.1 ProQ/FINO family protein [Alysiella filiformis DSM 16848]
MTQETALGAALKQAVQTLSKRKQTDLVAEHIYKKYEVFRRFRPLAVETEQDLIAALPQFDPQIIGRVLTNHCRRPKYLINLAMGGKRFNLNNRFQGEISPEEQQYALSQPNVAEAVEKLKARLAEKREQKAQEKPTHSEHQENPSS